MDKLVTLGKLGNINNSLKTFVQKFYKLLEIFSKLNITEVKKQNL